MQLKKETMPFSKLIIIYILWLLGAVLAGGLFEVYFFNLGMSLQEIYLADVAWFIAGFAIAPLFNGFNARNSMAIGILIMICASSILYFFPLYSAAYAYRIIIGFTHLFFWIPFNVLFYEFRKNNNATLGSLYYAITPLVSLIIPVISGFAATIYGFQALYLMATVVFVICLWMVMKSIADKRYEFTFINSIKSLSGLRTIIFFEGFSGNTIMSVTIVIMLMNYVNKPFEFGIFISLATVFSIIAAFILSKNSDKIKKRTVFIIPIIICFVLSAVLASWATDIAIFFLGFGLLTLFGRLFFPLNLALVVDNAHSLPEAMAGREFMLNLGRFTSAIIGYYIFTISNNDILPALKGCLVRRGNIAL